MRLWLAMGGMAMLAACSAPVGNRVVVQTDSAIVVRWDERLPRQSAEDLATRHCQQHGLVPRWVTSSFAGWSNEWTLEYRWFDIRYECQPKPRAT